MYKYLHIYIYVYLYICIYVFKYIYIYFLYVYDAITMLFIGVIVRALYIFEMQFDFECI